MSEPRKELIQDDPTWGKTERVHPHPGVGGGVDGKAFFTILLTE